MQILKIKIPKNPWSGYGITSKMWRIIYMAALILMTVGLAMSIVSDFLVEDIQYIGDNGSFILAIGMLILIASSKSEDDDEYDKIFQIWMMVLIIGVLAVAGMVYFVKFVL